MIGDAVSLAEETEAGPSPASALLELIGEKVPAERADAIRAFAKAYLRRLAGDASEGISPDHLLAEVLGVFEFASRRDEPVAVRVQPDPGRARLRAARLGGGDQHRRLAVPGRLGVR
jgi:hypothetical protein